ncbi:MAG TPA: TonB-dependent receptor [Nitrospirota bacterium]|nr:TonB-dependent receptor [Nitrospirota bacterium]
MSDFFCHVLAWFLRCGTGLRACRLVCLSVGMGCLLWGVRVSAGDLTGQNTSAGIVTLPMVTVQEKALDNARAQISPSLGATTYTLDSEKIDSQSQGEFASFDQTFYRFPGVAQDELDKRLHVRGEEANLQYRINGLLLPDGLSGFSQELSTTFLDSVSLITGILPAQYGNRTAGIVDIQTKSGRNLHGGTVSVYGGDYNTFMPIVEYGGSSGPFSGYGMVSYLHSSLGMANPAPTYRPTHDDTNQYKGFGNFSYLIDDTSRLTLILSGAYGTFEIPTIAGQEPQFPYGPITTFDSSKLNENQYEQAYYEILGYQKILGNIDLQLTQSMRFSDVSFKPDPVGDVIFNGIASDTDHQLISNNLQCDVSDRINDRHTVRGGFSLSVQHAAVNTTNTVLPVTVNGFGDPFQIVDNYEKTAGLYGAYLQDEWRITQELTVNYGLRADLWDAYITESQLSPRVNFVYKPVSPTTLHAGYGRYFTPPPLEFIQAGDVAKFDGTTNAVDPSLEVTAAIPVKSERYHYFDIGVNQDITPDLHVGVDAYYKIKKNVLDEGQFGPAMIFSPYNGDKALVRGVEVTASYEKGGFALWGNAARSQATAKGLTSGQWQFSPEEVAYMQSNWYHLDHDQDWTASAGGSYKWGSTKVYADALYGSGLYSGFANETELPGYTTFNVGMTHIFKLSPGNDLKCRLDVTNVTDLKYEIRDGDGIGVFAPQYLPRRAIYVGISKNI